MGDPLWFKDAVIYELHVRSFCDGNGDGIGDFKGLASKLGYLRDLGVTALWLLPFYPSPLLDDGYDVTEYRKVNPIYGTLADFNRFLERAHGLDLRVITELVVNHTSDRHPWFQRARKAKKGSPERGFYVWSDDPHRYRDARVILSDSEPSNWTWDKVAKQHYWHRFASHQPDLDHDNPKVQDAILEVVDFWMDLGVDGMRLDAVPYLFERDGTSCENLPETHAFLRQLRAQIDEKHEGKVLLAEACQWPEDTVPYFGNGDECHMSFHFPLVPGLFLALARADRTPIVDVFAETPAIPNACQWALFLRNHDDLSLEIVSEEERVEMWERYARDPRARTNLGIRRRLAPLLGGDREQIELLNSLLLALPGTPVLYYGDEIGMGDDLRLPDRHGLRTPMQWDDSSNAGFSKAPRKKLALPPVETMNYHWKDIHVAAQQDVVGSPLERMRELLRVRKGTQAFGRGSLRFLEPENKSILAFVREHAQDRVLVVCNLSARSQACGLDLKELAGWAPTEMFGQSRWQPIGDRPYGFTLQPHAFFWLRLEPATAQAPVRHGSTDPAPAWLQAQRWFFSKHRQLRSVATRGSIQVGKQHDFLVIRCEYAEGDGDSWFVAKRQSDSDGGSALLKRIASRKRDQQVIPETTSAFRGTPRLGARTPHAGEQANTTLLFGEQLALKIVRRFEPGENPDFEVPRFLHERTGFAHAAPAYGVLRVRADPDAEAWATVAILHGYVPNIGDAWRVVLGQLAEVRKSGPMANLREAIEHAQDLAPLLERLGRRLGQMHNALAGERKERAFTPEPFTRFYARGLFQSLRDQVRRIWTQVPKSLVVPPAEHVIARLEVLRKKTFAAERTRTHGDLHLGQVLVTPDRDAVFIDFEGDPTRPLSERRLKHCPLRDVAGIVRSLHWAAATAVREGGAETGADQKRLEAFGAWCEGWRASATEMFLEAYFTAVEGAAFVPQPRPQARELLDVFVLEKAVLELGRELGQRGGQVSIPLAGITELLEAKP